MQGKTRALQGAVGWSFTLVAVLVSLPTLDQLRLFGDPLLANLIVLETHFYYALIGLLLPLAFVYYRYADSPRYNLVAVDILLAMLSVYCSFWLFSLRANP